MQAKYHVSLDIKRSVLTEFSKLDFYISNLENKTTDIEHFIHLPSPLSSDNSAVTHSINKNSQTERDAINHSLLLDALSIEKCKVEALEKALHDAIKSASNTRKISYAKKIELALRSNLINKVPFSCQQVSAETMRRHRKKAIYYAAVNLGLIEPEESEDITSDDE